MPNTLAHLGVQGALSRGVWRGADLKWVYLACVVPDLPWILGRATERLFPAVDPYELRMYAVAQSSLFGCLPLCAALACLATSAGRVLALGVANCAAHLLLDALQTKWGNGAHLLAPFSWKLTNFGLFWPESPLTLALTLFGLGWVAWHGWHVRRGGIEPRARPGRVLAATACVAVWALLPLPLRTGVAASDSHFLRTHAEREARPGRYVELDRVGYSGAGRARIETFGGEELRVVGAAPARAGVVSIRGRFVDVDALAIDELHYHAGLWRDVASYFGLALIGLVWADYHQRRRKTASSRPRVTPDPGR